MRIRDSGMPDEEIWRGFFDVEAALSKLELTPDSGDVVEFGCGYGTFTLPAARVTQGTVHTFDVDPAMVRLTRDRARAEGLDNVRVVERDVFDAGTRERPVGSRPGTSARRCNTGRRPARS